MKIEVEVVDIRHAFVDDCARDGVPVPHGVLTVGGGEAGMVTFTTHDDGQRGSVWLAARLSVKFVERLKDAR